MLAPRRLFINFIKKISKCARCFGRKKLMVTPAIEEKIYGEQFSRIIQYSFLGKLMETYMLQGITEFKFSFLKLTVKFV